MDNLINIHVNKFINVLQINKKINWVNENKLNFD